MFLTNFNNHSTHRYLHRLPRKDSAIHQESGGEAMRTPSLPYPQSQDMESDVTNRSNSMPAFFQPGEQPDIVAPTPRPSQSPSWLNPSEMLESSLHNAPTTNTAKVEQEQDLPLLRFGRGERPDAEDEPESEDEFVLKRGKSTAHQESTSTPLQPTSPTILNQLQAVSLQEQPQQPQHHHHHHHHHQDHYHNPTSPNTAPRHENQSTVPTQYRSSYGSQVLGQGQSIDPQQPSLPQLPPTSSASQPLSPPATRAEVNTGEIPFGSESGSDLSSQFGMFQQQQHRH